MTNNIAFQYYEYADISNKTTFLNRTLDFLSEKGYFSELMKIQSEIEDREVDGCSVIAQSIAMPHIVSKYIERSVITLIRIPKGIDNWYNEMNVDTVLLLLISENIDNKSLSSIQKLISKLNQEENCSVLRTGKVEGILEMMTT